MKKVHLTEEQLHEILEAKSNAKYVLYADTMKCGNSDFMADMEESIDKQDLKKALKWIPEEAIIENGKEVYLDKIEKGDVALNKGGYIFVRQYGNGQDFFVYKKKDVVDESWKGAALGTALGAATLFGGGRMNAQNNVTPNQLDTIGYEIVNNDGTTNRYYKSNYSPEEWNGSQKYFRKQCAKKPYTEQELIKLCPAAYRDRNKKPEVWKRNQTEYTFDGENGQANIVGKTAAALGQNPWLAILNANETKTRPITVDNSEFGMDDFDIQEGKLNRSRRKIFLTESQIKYILSENLQQELQIARQETNTNPTEAQKEAGNYKMGRITIMGYKIAIENPKGSIRRGQDKKGNKWQVKMKNDYGYFTHTKAIDGDAVDVFIGSKLDSPNIFAIDQKIGGKFDETKVMLGFETAEEAKAAYMANYNAGWNGFWKITKVDHDTFKKWLYDGYKQRKPFYDYNEIKNNKLK